MIRKIIQISSFGVENSIGTQCNYVTTALCDDGSVWSCRDVDSYWMPLPEIPLAAEAAPEPDTVPVNREALEAFLAASDALIARIDRWRTPLWKDAKPTAGYIAALRDAADNARRLLAGGE